MPNPIEPAAAAPTITAADLASTTGYTVLELAALAKKGYFPKAEAGAYQITPSIKGCFRARKEQAEATGKLPTFTGMKQCAGATGIPLATLKRAKKAGCDAFELSRVSLGPLLRYLFAQDAITTGDPEERFKDARADREEMRRDRERGNTLNKSEVKTAVSRGVAALFSAMERRSTIELPPALRGLAEAEIQQRLLASDEELKAAFKAEMATLTGAA